MRRELTEAVAGLLGHLDYSHRPPAEGDDRAALVALASLVARSRSPVERDHQGEIVLVGDSEAPTRLVKALDRLRAGALAVGLEPAEAWRVTCKAGLDSIPKLRRGVHDHLANVGRADTTKVVAQALDHPTRTVTRALEDLAAHRVLIRQAGTELQAEGEQSADGRADYWELSPWAAGAVEMCKIKQETSVGDEALASCGEVLS